MPKIGIEIHQRLDTHKLFCKCPSIEREKDDKRIIRQFHTVRSELGEVDKAALEEERKGKVYEYIYDENTSCLVELDEEPPHEINEEAVKIALRIAKELNAKIVDFFFVMRKMVIDGSNTSGFQRTGIIALDGEIEVSFGKVKIPTICLEEESAGIVERAEKKDIYSLDRLGIPLIEISTEPVMKNGKEAKEVAEEIGLLLRATGLVKRGIGTIRQDLNVSVEGGARVEIKGAQELWLIEDLVENEIERQKNLMKVLEEMKKREIKKEKIAIEDITDLFEKTESKLIKRMLERKAKVLAIKLENFSGLLGFELNKGRRFGTELSDYAKTQGVKGILHSDENLEKYGISQDEIKKIKERLGCKENDAFVLVVEREEIAKRALEKVIERAYMDYIPEETRKANKDGTTSYMRPLPGKARMYPETDIPMVELWKISIPPFVSYKEKKEMLYKMLNKDLAEKMKRSRYLNDFLELVNLGFDPKIVAITLEDTLTMLRREGIKVGIEKVKKVLILHKEKKITKKAIPEVLKLENITEEGIRKKGLHRFTKEEIESALREFNGDKRKVIAKYKLNIEAEDLFAR